MHSHRVSSEYIFMYLPASVAFFHCAAAALTVRREWAFTFLCSCCTQTGFEVCLAHPSDILVPKLLLQDGNFTYYNSTPRKQNKKNAALALARPVSFRQIVAMASGGKSMPTVCMCPPSPPPRPAPPSLTACGKQEEGIEGCLRLPYLHVSSAYRLSRTAFLCHRRRTQGGKASVGILDEARSCAAVIDRRVVWFWLACVLCYAFCWGFLYGYVFCFRVFPVKG